MNWPSLFRVGLPASVLSVALLGSPPGGSCAQHPPVRESVSLSAAIAEAKRSPFHVRDVASGSVTPDTGPAAHFRSGASLHVGGQETGDASALDRFASSAHYVNAALHYVMYSIHSALPRLRSALLLGRIALLFTSRRALPARRLAALGARGTLSTDC